MDGILSQEEGILSQDEGTLLQEPSPVSSPEPSQPPSQADLPPQDTTPPPSTEISTTEGNAATSTEPRASAGTVAVTETESAKGTITLEKIATTTTTTTTESVQERSSENEQQGSIPQKRPVPKNDESASSGEDSSPAATESNQEDNDNAHARADSPPSPKKRRISLPGRSILKSAGADDEDLTGNQETPDHTGTIDNGELSGVDITETFSSTTEFLKRSRKSIGRRVSFAATARIRMFERDDKEDEHAKTMSFLEGNKVTVNPNNIPFTFQSSSQDNDTNHTASSMESSDPIQDKQEDENTQNTQTSHGSSDSEKERSFEVNVAHGFSDTTSGSSEANNGLYLQSLLPPEGLGNFDDMGHSSDSSSDDDVNYFPDAHLMKRSSGVGIFEGDQDADLGPQFEIGQSSHSHFSQQLDHLDDGTGDMSLVSEDYSMDFKFQKHRSSLPGRQPTPFGGNDKAEDSTTDFSNNLQLLAAHAASSSAAPLQELTDLESVTDIVNEAMIANARQSLDMLDEQIPGDEDTDMDITAPIGTGIQDLAHEMPPMAFHTAEDHTAMFSEFGSQMDMTQTIGVGIVEADLVAPSTQDDTASQLGTPMDMTQPIGGIVEAVQITTSTQGDRAPQAEKTKDAESIIDINAQQAPATPRRQSFNSRASLRASFGATEVPTDQSQTGSEQHENERRQPPFNEPVFQAPQISPATTNLAKKIDRFSVGEPSGSASGLQEDDTYNTMDFLREQRARRAIVGASMDGGDISRDNTNDFTNDFTNDHSMGAPEPDAADVSYDTGGDEDSISELPPISLSQFLGLVGISFLDQLYTSTRRRTIPHMSSSSESYRSADLIKAKAIFTQELNSYREACRLLKQSIEKTRAFCLEQEKKVLESNPDYIREFRESNSDTKEFIKDRLKLVKSHAKLDTSVQFSGLKSELLERQQASLEEHLDKLKKDIANLGQLASELSKEKAKVTPRHAELKRIVEQATARRRAYAQCDKEQLRMLTEAVDEQGTQIEHFKSVNERKEKELAEVRARVAQLRLSEQTSKERVAAAEKTIQDNQYVRPEDVSQAKDRLRIIQATHRWEPLRSSSESFPSVPGGSAFMVAKAGSSTLEFVYDKAVVVVIDPSKIGKDLEAVKVSAFEEEAMVDFDLSLADQPRLLISALACKTRPSMKDYFPLLRDYTTMVAAKYKSGTTISKILSDVSQFWTRICLIRRDIELVRAHHVVDLVAGSAENLKELELNASPQTSRRSLRQVAPVVLLDIRVRFTGPILGASARRRVPEQSGGGKKNGHQNPEEEPVKFYLWFTFTLSDLLSFPGPNSFTWRLEVVYGDISHEHVAQAVSPCVKKGGYDVMRDICLKVNQLLRT